ncbi:PrgI family protein [Frankia sp. CNm7]|uniref:PrgI family protein n=1 Tax=Frankia nepalensis TaxID=1836974 RepID=A0A937UQI6_9ACTN|nr:PrgI family protein [Frankia nepalensis]MBL7496187.1 PrgI family protein [Frankia nepalensis]MBL7511597.1 PrgI family protein [Frankia nepalensis]MBL7520633.1 PrgI family protein [Frankia nepalensis]MBL7630272.1 PrgI family protein [Frankia nepalensis]
MTHPVRIPADIDREDRLLGNLTARQLLILAAAGALLYLAWLLTASFVPLPLFALGAVPVVVTAAVLALGQRDGLSLDRLLLAAARQRDTPRRQVSAPEGITPPPAWLTDRATHQPEQTGRRGRDRQNTEPPAPLRFPTRDVTHAGMIDLGADGVATVAVASTVNFALRTPGEQEALVAAFARYLHSLTSGVQILVRAERLDLSAQIHELHAAATALPHPALAAAAVEHAGYLGQLATDTDLLHRQVLLVLREPLAGSTPADGLGAAAGAARHRRRTRDSQRAADAARRAAQVRLVRRLAEAADLLAPAGIVITPLGAGAVTGVLASACNPAGLLSASEDLAAPDDIITAAEPEPAPPDPISAPGGRRETTSPGWIPTTNDGRRRRASRRTARRPTGLGPYTPEASDAPGTDEDSWS